MKLRVLPIALVAFCFAGCTGNDANVANVKLPPGAGQPLNPNGRPKTPAEASVQDVQNRAARQTQSSISQEMQAMAAARQKAGGK